MRDVIAFGIIVIFSYSALVILYYAIIKKQWRTMLKDLIIFLCIISPASFLVDLIKEYPVVMTYALMFLSLLIFHKRSDIWERIKIRVFINAIVIGEDRYYVADRWAWEEKKRYINYLEKREGKTTDEGNNERLERIKRVVEDNPNLFIKSEEEWDKAFGYDATERNGSSPTTC